MRTRNVIVASASGLHARPARVFVSAAAGTNVRIAKNGAEPVDASSILRVMSLGVAHGDEVTLCVEGDDTTALDRLAELLARDLDAE
ncbi:HPr family phosphocarrier protein [Streptomyces demainii]|uniref:Phosphocarrier protein n=1 Tax=Streptomyces demainii TaxID=588122 RepID=A0ABT9KW36_9ACTN|nr:HPr family phosphocarrier protein [Streptomyces demainii]MDP9612658.1 phosphocarrier protein [Streptomyces demainii]